MTHTYLKITQDNLGDDRDMGIVGVDMGYLIWRSLRILLEMTRDILGGQACFSQR